MKEECGISELSVNEELEVTYYLYLEGENLILKKTTWFLMNTSEDGPFKGDSKEGISEVKWMNAEAWNTAQSKSFPSVIDLLTPVF